MKRMIRYYSMQKRQNDRGRIPLKFLIFFFLVNMILTCKCLSFAQEHGQISEKTTFKPVITNGLLSLNLSETLQMAIDGNRDIQISSLYPSIAEEDLKISQSVYDSSLFAENNIARTDRPTQSYLDNGLTEESDFLENRWYFRAGIKKPVQTGGIVSIFTEADRLNSSSDLVIPNPQNTSRLTFQLRQALLKEFGDKSNKSAIEIAGLNLDISEYEYRKTISSVMREVAISYWRFVYYQKRMNISHKALEEAENIYQRISVRNENGLSDMIDVDRALSAVQDRKRRLTEDNTLNKTSMDQLKLLIGLSPDSTYFSADIVPTEQLEGESVALQRDILLEEAFQTRPEFVIAQKNKKVAEIEKKLARHQMLPKLDAKASYSFNSLGNDFNDAAGDTFFSDNASWAIGLELEWPLGGRKEESQYQKSLLKYQQTISKFNKTVEQISYEVNSSINEIMEISQEIEAALQAREAYKRVLDREETRFEMAQINNQGLLDAQDDFYEAEFNYLRAILNYNISLLKLKWAKGTLPEDFGIVF